MKAFQLDYSSSWKYLPWNQIKERIFVLQIQIREASKSCNNSLMYKIQNILVNSNEAKILAIEEIFQSFSGNSLYYNQDYYKLSDTDKCLIFYSLFRQQHLNMNLAVLREKIKQYLIYLCLQPEWEARFEPGLQSSMNTLGSYLFQEKLFRFLNYNLIFSKNCFGISFYSQVNNKYINTKYIIQKVQSGNYIDYCLEFWLNNNYIQFDQDFMLISFKLYLLYQLLHRIILNGIQWFYCMINELHVKGRQYNIYENLFIFCEMHINCWIFIDHTCIQTLTFVLKFLGLNTKKINTYNTRSIYKNYNLGFSYIYSTILDRIKSLNLIGLLIIKIVNNISNPLLLRIKSLLYKKDLINRLRINSNIDISKVTSTISELTLQFYDYYSLFLPLRIIKSIYQKIDFILYSWIKKRSKNKNLYKLIIHRNKQYLMKSLVKSRFYIINQICIEKLNRK